MSPKVAFSDIDAWLFYAVPKPGADLETIVRYYTFINRTYPPSRKQLESWMSKGLQVGILEKHEGRLVLSDEWYDRIHAADDIAENEIVSMLDFQDFLLSKYGVPDEEEK